MYLAFYENRYGGILDRVIRWKTATWKQRFNGSWKDLPSHCELVFSDGMMFSASSRENIVRFKKHSFTGKAWDRIELCTNKEKDIREWCETKEGLKYDYLGVLGFVIPFIKDRKNRWFCSEICSEALKQFNIIYIDDSSNVSPVKLNNIIKVKK